MWWTSLPTRTSTLTAWAGGPKAENLLFDDYQLGWIGLSPHLHGHSAYPAAPSMIFCNRVRRTIGDRTLLAYTYVRAGGAGALKVLATPVQGTLFFAGEATEDSEMGTVGGALASGKRADDECIRALRRHPQRKVRRK